LSFTGKDNGLLPPKNYLRVWVRHEKELSGPCAEEIRDRRNAAEETKEKKIGE